MPYSAARRLSGRGSGRFLIREMLSRSREEGMQQSVRQIIQNMISQKYTDQQILEICGITPQYLASIKKETKEL